MSFAHLPGGEDNIQFTGGKLGILVKGLVEITQSEKNDGIRIAAFYPEVLLADGG